MTLHDLYLLPDEAFQPDAVFIAAFEDDLTDEEWSVLEDWNALIASTPGESELDFDLYEHDAPLCVLLAA